MAHITAPPPAGFDRAAAQQATQAHLERLIGFDTQNPPGNELLAARYLDDVFAGMDGAERHILETAPGRANFVARLRAANPTKRPIIVMGHTDVVGADAASWTSPPFEASVRDGYLYGRGAIDDKGMLAASVAAMQQLAAQRDTLSRDVIFMATAAEEGGPDIGVQEMVTTHWELIADAEFALNEGGRARLHQGRVRTVNIQTTEKVPYAVLATAEGPSGHASVPLPDNALAALARAVARVHEWRAPVRLNETTRLYFARLAGVEEDAAMRAAMATVGREDANEREIGEAAAVLSRNPLHDAVLRTGQSLTLLAGGIRGNVIPGEGAATFNVRTLPGDDIAEIVAAMQAAGGEPRVTFTLAGDPHPAPPPSPVGSPLYRAMESAATTMDPDTVVLPFMSTGATDGAALRAKGIPTYGILPLPLLMEDELRMHGHDERVPVASLGWGAEYLYRVMVGVM